MRGCFTAVDYGLPEHQPSIGPVLRPLIDATAQELVRDLVLQGYAEHEAETSEVPR